MRLHRFFVKDNIEGKTEIHIKSEELINQIRNVFRLKSNDSIIIFNGSGFDFQCSIVEIKDNIISLKVVDKEKSRYMPVHDIYLCVGIVKKDTFEWIVEKATELGVTHIIPVIAERSEKKFLNYERLVKISIEASEQSGRGNIPVIEEIQNLNDILCKKNINKIAYHTDGKIEKKVDESNYNAPIMIFIGPEGGWSPKEIQMFHENNIDIYCLGKQVLRSETAVIATLSRYTF